MTLVITNIHDRIRMTNRPKCRCPRIPLQGIKKKLAKKHQVYHRPLNVHGTQNLVHLANESDSRVPVKCETKQKRNGTKRNRSKRNETDRNETKQIETKRNKTKRNKSKRNETNDMARHCGQKSVFSNIRKSFSI